jgi:outer membrane biosynthesis protein TonB
MPRPSAFLIVLSIAAAALGLVACGGGDAELLPGETASEIDSNLGQVEQLASEGDCLGASDAAQAVSLQVEELSGVDAQLQQALEEGAARLNEVVAGCEEAIAEEEEEPAEAIEEAEEPEGEERAKPKKAAKPEAEGEEADEEGKPSLPPQAEGEAKGHEKPEEEAPPSESGGTPSGGVGPGVPAEGEG